MLRFGSAVRILFSFVATHTGKGTRYEAVSEYSVANPSLSAKGLLSIIHNIYGAIKTKNPTSSWAGAIYKSLVGINVQKK